MADEAVLRQLETERTRTRQLQEGLAPRWKDEGAQLARLEVAVTSSKGELEAANAELPGLEAQRQLLTEELPRLKRGLSQLRLVWVRVVEPLALAAVLFAGFLALAYDRHPGSWGRAAGGAVLGAVLGLALRRLYVR